MEKEEENYMFKNIKAVFEAKGNKNFCHVVVKRFVSGATPYGDTSGHSLELINEKQVVIENRYYDTRYDGISTKKDEWVKTWKEFVEDRYGVELELIGYEEKEE